MIKNTLAPFFLGFAFLSSSVSSVPGFSSSVFSFFFRLTFSFLPDSFISLSLSSGFISSIRSVSFISSSLADFVSSATGKTASSLASSDACSTSSSADTSLLPHSPQYFCALLFIAPHSRHLMLMFFLVFFPKNPFFGSST